MSKWKEIKERKGEERETAIEVVTKTNTRRRNNEIKRKLMWVCVCLVLCVWDCFKLWIVKFGIHLIWKKSRKWEKEIELVVF